MLDVIPLRNRPSTMWPVVARPRQPYTFRQIEVVDDVSTTDLNAEIFMLDGPIHPYLLGLEAGNAHSFLDFVARLGLDELLRWISSDRYVDTPQAWRRVIGTWSAGHSQIDKEALTGAWTDEETFHRFTRDRLYLLDLIDLLSRLKGDKDAYATTLDIYQDVPILRIRFEVIRHPQGHPQLVERPDDIFARAAFEFLDGLTERGLFPRTCPYCSNPFMPTRRDQRYCPGTDHQQRGADQRRSRDPRRREYHRLRARIKRAKTDEERAKAEAELDQWRDASERR